MTDVPFVDQPLTGSILFFSLGFCRMADRIRLLTLYFITQSAPHDVRNNFFQLSRCDYNLRESATNIEYLGVKLDVVSLRDPGVILVIVQENMIT
jgi:hypothetical protein